MKPKPPKSWRLNLMARTDKAVATISLDLRGERTARDLLRQAEAQGWTGRLTEL